MSNVCGDKLPSGNILEDYEDCGAQPQSGRKVTMKCKGKKGGKKR
jgi:hypothetical protein